MERNYLIREISDWYDAYEYAKKTSLGPTDWPRFVYVNSNNCTITDLHYAVGFYYITKRDLDDNVIPEVTPQDTKTARILHRHAKKAGLKFLDYIIIGEFGAISFDTDDLMPKDERPQAVSV